MSLKRVIETLSSLGLSQTDAKVYISIAVGGLKIASAIVDDLNVSKGQVYRSLNRLRMKGIMSASKGHPREFTVVPFEEVLNLLIRVKKEQTDIISETREELLSSFRKMTQKNLRKTNAA